MANTDIDFIQNDDGTTNLTSSFSKIMSEFDDLNKIPNYRPDLKAAEAQRLAQKSICLTGELFVRFERVEAQVMGKSEAEKQQIPSLTTDNKTIH